MREKSALACAASCTRSTSSSGGAMPAAPTICAAIAAIVSVSPPQAIAVRTAPAHETPGVEAIRIARGTGPDPLSGATSMRLYACMPQALS